MRIVVAECTVDYTGRLEARLPRARRAILVKGDGSVVIHSDAGGYKPLMWMSAPCRIDVGADDAGGEGAGVVWRVRADKGEDALRIVLHRVLADVTQDLGADPGLIKDGVEADLQRLLADQVPDVLGAGWSLVGREYPTPIGPVDLMVRDPEGRPVAIEVKRRGGVDGVEQLTRYLAFLSREPGLGDIRGIFAAQEIAKQARTLAGDRGIQCVVLDYAAMRGTDDSAWRLF